ncbi:MAG: ATP-binding protein [Acidobacteriota bacterium]
MDRDASVLFPTLDAEQIRCVREVGEARALEPGDTLFAEGGETADFFVVLDGKIRVTQRVAGEDQVLAVHGPAEFTGAADLLTGAAASATGRAVEATRVVRLDPEQLRRVIAECPELGRLILRAMAARTNTEYAFALQKEKMAALGKLSAGLAHELNNPAAAARRSALGLDEILDQVEELTVALARPALLGAESGDQGNGSTERALCLAPRETPRLGALERSDREDELAEWLEEHGAADPWCHAPILVDLGLGPDDLAPRLETLCPEARGPYLSWLAKIAEARSLTRDLAEATSRMSSLVQAMKSYSHMDQSRAKDAVDLHQGLDNTLVILGHKARRKSIAIETEWSHALEHVPGWAGELNQVWTNLLDNAIQALGDGGTIRLESERENDHAIVRVIDDGPGIPREIQGRIFEPFFTTKDVGQGTGLGLDAVHRIVVDRHNGTIRVDSEPGRTSFEVHLPLS